MMADEFGYNSDTAAKQRLESLNQIPANSPDMKPAPIPVTSKNMGMTQEDFNKGTNELNQNRLAAMGEKPLPSGGLKEVVGNIAQSATDSVKQGLLENAQTNAKVKNWIGKQWEGDYFKPEAMPTKLNDGTVQPPPVTPPPVTPPAATTAQPAAAKPPIAQPVAAQPPAVAPAQKTSNPVLTDRPDLGENVSKITDAKGRVTYTDKGAFGYMTEADKAKQARNLALLPDHSTTAGIGRIENNEMAAVQAARKGRASNNFTEKYLAENTNKDTAPESLSMDVSKGGNISQAAGVNSDALYRNEQAQRLSKDTEKVIKVRDATHAIAEGAFPLGREVTNDRSKVANNESSNTGYNAQGQGSQAADKQPAFGVAHSVPVAKTGQTPSPKILQNDISDNSGIKTDNKAESANGVFAKTKAENPKGGLSILPSAPTPPTEQNAAMPVEAMTGYKQAPIKSNVLPDRFADEEMQRNIRSAQNAIAAAMADPSNGKLRGAAHIAERNLKQLMGFDVDGNQRTQQAQQELGQKDLSQRRDNSLKGWQSLLQDKNEDARLAQSGKQFSDMFGYQSAKLEQEQKQADARAAYEAEKYGNEPMPTSKDEATGETKYTSRNELIKQQQASQIQALNEQISKEKDPAKQRILKEQAVKLMKSSGFSQ